jgi:hypothetical protein
MLPPNRVLEEAFTVMASLGSYVLLQGDHIFMPSSIVGVSWAFAVGAASAIKDGSSRMNVNIAADFFMAFTHEQCLVAVLSLSPRNRVFPKKNNARFAALSVDQKFFCSACGILHNQPATSNKPRNQKAAASKAHRKKKGMGVSAFFN